MVGKGKSIAHGAKAIDYALKKEKAVILEKSGIVGGSGKEIKKEFRITQELNENCRNTELSLVLSPSIMDGNKLSNEDFKELTKEFIKKLKLEKHQYISILHSDKKHKHVHIFVNRIDFKGKAYVDSFIGKKCQLEADNLAKEKGFVRSKEVPKLKKEALKGIRKEIYELHKETLNKNPKDFNEYIFKMKLKGITIIPTINKNGKLQGFRVSYKGINLKASEIHRKMSLQNYVIGKIMGLNPVFRTISVGLKIYNRLKDFGKEL
ncbi:relaxase/mobilization nuclease domain-containing protein [Aureivirga sp. CE67]|uniref:relaxase/mobilization nuclease domain-containing protein n=1 Tax=Aureivirga sp. CE67 TaxID=1788983 RepID=UPI0018CB0360|nr:relaxase/mobilization nuclease domain-containing protein [Aureivirga sp. CE67]